MKRLEKSLSNLAHANQLQKAGAKSRVHLVQMIFKVIGEGGW